MAEQIRKRNDVHPSKIYDDHGAIVGWSCPEGYEFPRCTGCGHTFYEMEPQTYQEELICKWCAMEQSEGEQ
jgi:formylmethanofuran dehydrogenase subunit E